MIKLFRMRGFTWQKAKIRLNLKRRKSRKKQLKKREKRKRRKRQKKPDKTSFIYAGADQASAPAHKKTQVLSFFF